MSEIKLPPLPAEYYLVCGRRTWDEKDMQEYARQAVREAVPDSEQVAEHALRRVLEVVRGYLPPDGMLASAAMSEIIALVDPWPLGDLKGPK